MEDPGLTVLLKCWALISWRQKVQYVSYLFRDFGGNSNSPTEMVSTALSETLMTCWHSRLMKSYLHTSSDLHDRSNHKETEWSSTSLPDLNIYTVANLSVISTSLSLSLFQWSTLQKQTCRKHWPKSLNMTPLSQVSVSAVLFCKTDHLLCEQPDTQHLSILGGQSHGPDVAHSLLDGTWLGSPPQKQGAYSLANRLLNKHSPWRRSSPWLWPG